jgi:uncharacterized membrane protein HdeD (DUF308 family)
MHLVSTGTSGGSSVTATPAKRPGGVTFLGVLVIISGILYVAAGMVALFAAVDPGLSSTERIVVMVVGIATIALGVVELAVASGLFRGRNPARVIVAVVNVLTIAVGVFSAFQPGNQRGSSVAQVAIAVIVLALLYSPKANEFFARGGARGA